MCRTNPPVLYGFRKHHVLPRPQGEPWSHQMFHRRRRTCLGDYLENCCWSLEMEKMSVFPVSSHSHRIRNVQSASSRCWYKLTHINCLLVRNLKKTQPPVPSPLLQCSLLTSGTTTGSPSQYDKWYYLHGCFRDVQTFSCTLKFSYDWGTQGYLGEHKGKAIPRTVSQEADGKTGSCGSHDSTVMWWWSGSSRGFPRKLECPLWHFLLAHFLPPVRIQKIWQLPSPAQPVLMAHHVL